LLVNSDLGQETELAKELPNIPNVVEVNLVYGTYDIILKMQGETMEKLKEIIATKIRQNDNVRSTLKTIVVDAK
jgi:DNA-binding Lrp family transcriptional regulator